MKWMKIMRGKTNVFSILTHHDYTIHPSDNHPSNMNRTAVTVVPTLLLSYFLPVRLQQKLQFFNENLLLIHNW